MFGWLRKKVLGSDPQKGEKWQLRFERSDPWGGKKYKPTVILDVKNGWVRYCVGGYHDGPFCDERMKIGTFVSIYRRVA